jgi:methionyl-tRNA formyltransferase
LTPPPVKVLAQEFGLDLIQPHRLSEPEAMHHLRAWSPDLIVVAAFGQILRSEVLDLPKVGCINVHASLLPRWRGAAPIPAAILSGDTKTGITIMCMDEGVDTGPTLNQKSIPIEEDDTTGSLSEKLADLGAGLLIDTLPSYIAGELQPQSQDDQYATYAPMLKKQEGELDFNQPAIDLVRRIKAFNPWPGTFTEWRGGRLKVHRAHAGKAKCPNPGERTVHQGFPAFFTVDGVLVLDEIQPAGKKPMPGDVFLRGARDWGQ